MADKRDHDAQDIDYKCAECGGVAISANRRVLVIHEPFCTIGKRTKRFVTKGK